jgi:predicted transcriptional regulator
MSKDVATLSRGDSLSVVDDVMNMRRIRHFPVLDDEGKLVGILSQRDLFRAGLSSTMGYGGKANKDYLTSVRVDDVMTLDVITISPDDDVKDAALTMLTSSIGCLPVVEGGKLLGVITESDILRFVAEA